MEHRGLTNLVHRLKAALVVSKVFHNRVVAKVFLRKVQLASNSHHKVEEFANPFSVCGFVAVVPGI